MPTLTLESKLLLLCLHLLSLFSICTSNKGAAANRAGAKNVQGMFVFGSSIVDNGNNNHLNLTSARANFLPYGIDFPHGPSGRFSNGKNTIDFLAEYLNLPLIPPYLDPSTNGKRILNGVNFASGSSGILDSTGSFVGQRLTLNNQIYYFETVTLPKLESQLKSMNGNISLSDYLFVFGVGANDYTFNYFRVRGSQNIEDFTTSLTTKLSTQLKKLYSLGGRKFVLMATYPIGCCPGLKRDSTKPNECDEDLNKAAILFNTHLNNTVRSLRTTMPGSKFVIINQYEIIMDIIKDPTPKGFKNVSSPCCEIKIVMNGKGYACKEGGKVCKERSSYVYFDNIHPTQAVNEQIASKAFTSTNKMEVYPFNVQKLALMRA